LQNGGSENSRFVGDEMMMQTWRWTQIGLLQTLEVTAIGRHSRVGKSGKGRHGSFR